MLTKAAARSCKTDYSKGFFLPSKIKQKVRKRLICATFLHVVGRFVFSVNTDYQDEQHKILIGQEGNTQAPFV